ncbi:hypothetical protein [Pseudomonas sp. Marseille-QA0892]
MALMKCKECGHLVSTTAKACPNCGAKPSKPSGGSFLITCVGLAVFLVVIVKACSSNSEPAHTAAPYKAPIEAGAIPSRIGCDEGCDKLNKFEQWQPYLSKVAELHREQRKCKKVVYVSVDHESNPSDPEFFVMCENEKGQSYNTFYTRSQVESSQVASSEDVSRSTAFAKCDAELPAYFPNYSKDTPTSRGFYVAPNGVARVTYDLVISGRNRKANCLVGHDFLEFTVVQ